MDIDGIVLLNADHQDLVLHHYYSQQAPEVNEVIKLYNHSDQSSGNPITQSGDGEPLLILYHINDTDSKLVLIAFATRLLPDAVAVIEYLYRVISILNGYFSQLSPSVVSSNADQVIRILTELIDGRTPNPMYLDAIQDIVPPTSIRRSIMSGVGLASYEPPSKLSAIPWRKSFPKHQNQDFNVDLIEAFRVLISPVGKVLKTEVNGLIKCNCRITDPIPDITMSVTPAAMITLPSFHPCVRLSRWTKNPGTLSFIPPDGSFIVQNYTSKLSYSNQLPVEAAFDVDNGDNGEFRIKLRIDRVKSVAKVITKIRLNPSIYRCEGIQASHGQSNLNMQDECLEWLIPSKKAMPNLDSSQNSASFRVKFVVASRGAEDSYSELEFPKYVTVDYECENWLSSGLSISNIDIREASSRQPKRNIFQGVKKHTSGNIVYTLAS